MPSLLVNFALAGIASLVASLAFAGDLAISELSSARIAALGTNGPHARTFARIQRDADLIHSRWLIIRVSTLSIGAVLLSDAMQGVTRWPYVFGILVNVLVYGFVAEILAAIAERRPERVAVLAVGLLRPLEFVVLPVADPLFLLGRNVGRRVPESRIRDAMVTHTEVEVALSEGERTGAIPEEPAEMIRNVLDFKNLTVREVMVPRRKVSALELDTPMATVLAAVAADGHSRYPVYHDTLDNVVGLVYVKDLFAQRDIDDKVLSDFVRKPTLVVVESQSALSVLREMRAKRLHMAIVADEFGGTDGIVTLEDILEEIVGEIDDEHDTEVSIQPLGDGRFVADATMPLADLEGHLGRAIEADGDFESLGGLLVHRAGKVPTVGETITLDGYKFVVREADETRVVRVEIISPPVVLPT